MERDWAAVGGKTVNSALVPEIVDLKTDFDSARIHLSPTLSGGWVGESPGMKSDKGGAEESVADDCPTGPACSDQLRDLRVRSAGIVLLDL